MLNIVLFTPVNNDSAIACVSDSLVGELKESGNNVTIISTENYQVNRELCFPNLATFIRPGNQDTILPKVYDADIILYQIGNSYSYHSEAIHWLFKFPGIVILHDWYLGDLLNGITINYESISNQIFQEVYGVSRAYILDSKINKRRGVSLNKPYFSEWVALQSVGIVVHSQENIEYFEKIFLGKIIKLDLIFNFNWNKARISNSLTVNRIKKKMILTFGNINTNRGVEYLIEVLSQSYVLNDIYYLGCAGNILPEYKNKLEELALVGNVDLIFFGKVHNEVLASLITEAFIVNCLRDPVYETGSASLVTSFSFGKPVLVHNHGHYSSIPSEVVMKVEPGKEIEFISMWLLKVLESPDFLIGISNNSISYFRSINNLSSYACKLINFSLKNMRYLEIFKIKSDLENYLNDSAFNFIPQTYLENISQTLRNNFY